MDGQDKTVEICSHAWPKWASGVLSQHAWVGQMMCVLLALVAAGWAAVRECGAARPAAFVLVTHTTGRLHRSSWEDLLLSYCWEQCCCDGVVSCLRVLMPH